MVDQSELAFRIFMKDHGADLAFSPMIHAHLFITDPTYRRTSMTTIKNESNNHFIIQFCANEPETLLMACRYVEGFCQGVDLNLGCPQLIAKRGNYGAYLQEKRDLIREMVNKVYRQSLLPISVKVRIQDSVAETISYVKMLEEAGASMITIHGRTREQKGVNTGIADWNHIAEVRKMLEEAGASMITIHGRTREQKGVNTGIADWNHIAEVRKVLSIPVIANGNIQLPGDVEKCLEATGADAVMSAEGILFNPLLFLDSFEPCYLIAKKYMKYARKFQANSSAIRAHIFRICHHALIKFDDLRRNLSVVADMEGFEKIIDDLEQRISKESSEYDRAKQQFATVDQSCLRHFVENTPNWFAKPYIRPIQLAEEKEVSEYRINKRAEIQKMSDSTGLSKRQIKKKERRRVDFLRVKEARKEYPPCQRCSMPAGVACCNFCCKKCCRLICIVEYKSCKIHKYVAEKLKPKREAFLQNSEVQPVVSIQN
uniref:DUS-like FMN-binding domain-containing protein n=1 Tax=Panagrolaimus sp. JU765 TaxID=591449 RepID=A0AC34QZP2_9BILA